MSFSLSSRAKRVGIAITLALMLPALTGCVYLRLLHFKNQLKSFDENVSILPGNELVFEFSKPIVKNSDFVFITGSQPSRIDFVDSAGYNEWWTWHFQKRTSIDSDRPFRMTFRAHFQDDLLTRLRSIRHSLNYSARTSHKRFWVLWATLRSTNSDAVLPSPSIQQR